MDKSNNLMLPIADDNQYSNLYVPTNSYLYNNQRTERSESCMRESLKFRLQQVNNYEEEIDEKGIETNLNDESAFLKKRLRKKRKRSFNIGSANNTKDITLMNLSLYMQPLKKK